MLLMKCLVYMEVLEVSDYRDGFDDGYKFAREEMIEKLREIDIADIDAFLLDKLSDMIEENKI